MALKPDVGIRRDSMKNEIMYKKFIKACEEGLADEVKVILNCSISKPDFPRKDFESSYRPPIYWACKGGHLEIVKLLIQGYPGCNPFGKTERGNNLLYVACTRGHIEVVKYLSQVYSISATEPNTLGATPIFAATNNGHYKMLKFLICELKCNPHNLNTNGDSLLHVACGKNHLDIAQYLVQEHGLKPELVNNSKKTPLHSACSSGNLPIVKYLINDLKCCTDVFDNAGCTPLHDACRNGYFDIVHFFTEKNVALSLYDSSGCTPFHLACKYGRKDVVKFMLNHCKIDPNSQTLAGILPIEIARDRYIITQLIRGGASVSGMKLDIFNSYKVKQPLHSIVHIFMIGHSASGKSTLVKALQISSKRSRSSNIKPNTAGIIPIEVDSPEFGRVILYDFAGQYEFHPCHAALLEHSNYTSPPLFLLVINLLDTFEDTKRKLNYWIQFVEDNSKPEFAPPHVIVVGSHYDLLSKDHASIKCNVEEYVRSRLQSSILILKGFFPIDCRVPGKQNNFRSCLKESCYRLHTKEEVESTCHVLHVMILQHFHSHFACSIQQIIKVATELDYPLPTQVEHLCELSEALSARTKILFLKNHHDPKTSWIILDIDALLHTINGKIFAPKDFSENVFKPTLTGILPWSQLTKHFDPIDPSLIVAFLSRLELCQLISEPEVLSLIEGKQSESSDLDIERDSPHPTPPVRSISVDPRVVSESTPRHMLKKLPIPSFPNDSQDRYSNSCPSLTTVQLKEKYLFFPGLISPEQPKEDMWIENDTYALYSGWCLQCTSDRQFFNLRFIQTLLLRLSFSFAVIKCASGLCEQKCTLWKNGIRWLSWDGIETIVEVVEDCKAVLLLIRVKQDSVMKGLHLRAAVIKKVLDIKEKYCSNVCTCESLIDPIHLRARHAYPIINKPIDTLTRYDVLEIAKVFCLKKRYVSDMKGLKLIEIEKILKFDPYMNLGEEYLQKLYKDDAQDQLISEVFLWEFSRCYTEPEMTGWFEEILLSEEIRRSPFPREIFGIFDRFRESGPWKLCDFRRKLDEYTIFCGRNILEVSSNQF